MCDTIIIACSFHVHVRGGVWISLLWMIHSSSGAFSHYHMHVSRICEVQLAINEIVCNWQVTQLNSRSDTCVLTQDLWEGKVQCIRPEQEAYFEAHRHRLGCTCTCRVCWPQSCIQLRIYTYIHTVVYDFMYSVHVHVPTCIEYS